MDQSRIKIAAIGDSIVYGRHDTGHGGWIGRLRASLEHLNPMSSLFNLGIGGDTAANVLQRVHSEVPPRRVDSAILGVGTNDARIPIAAGAHESQTAKSDFERTYREILSTLTEDMGLSVLVCPIFPVDEARSRPLGNFIYLNEINRDFFSSQRAISAEFERAMFVDTWDEFSSDATLFSDGIHLSAKGHSLVSDIFLERVRSLILRV